MIIENETQTRRYPTPTAPADEIQIRILDSSEQEKNQTQKSPSKNTSRRGEENGTGEEKPNTAYLVACERGRSTCKNMVHGRRLIVIAADKHCLRKTISYQTTD